MSACNQVDVVFQSINARCSGLAGPAVKCGPAKALKSLQVHLPHVCVRVWMAARSVIRARLSLQMDATRPCGRLWRGVKRFLGVAPSRWTP